MGDSERDLSDIGVKAYTISTYAQVPEAHIGESFWGPAGEALEADGFRYVGDVDLRLPAGLLIQDGTIRPTMFIDPVTALVAISVFVGLGVGGWAVDKVCDAVWGKLRGPLRTMLTRRHNEGYSDQPVSVGFGAWYDTDGVYIGAMGEIRADENVDQVSDLFPEAQRRGRDWIQTHGITKPVVMFRIKNGSLASVPTLLDSIPN